MVKYYSLNDFLSKKITPHIKKIQFFLWNNCPGPSGEFAIRTLLYNSLCNKSKEDVKALVVPCVRKEKNEKIVEGTHLSLFFMLIVIVTGHSSYYITKKILEKIINSKLNLEEIAIQLNINKPKVEKIKDFYIKHGGFETAKNFPFYGNGVQVCSLHNYEIAHFVKVMHTRKNNQDVKVGHMFGIGIERLLMHCSKETNIWNTYPFNSIVTNTSSYIDMDYARQERFFRPDISGQNKQFEKCLLRRL